MATKRIVDRVLLFLVAFVAWHFLDSHSIFVIAQPSRMTLKLYFDDYPPAVFWTLSSDEQGIVASKSRDSYNTSLKFMHIQEYIPVEVGRRYDFVLGDYHNNPEHNGGTSVYAWLYHGEHELFQEPDEDLIARANEFDGDEHPIISFVAQLPSNLPPPSTPTLNTWPTPAPTTCDETINLDIPNDPFDRYMEFTDEAFEFGAAHSVCAQHSSYQDCTNEDGEDCQWVFLTQSERKGRCRVDPISKCLETGDCMCFTEDFHGGTSDGILFHVPVSITKRDIGPFRQQVKSMERFAFPRDNASSDHRLDDNFYISKVDFTGRQLVYDFPEGHPLAVQSSDITVLFKLHYLYTDLPIKGTVWDGLGLFVEIDTSNESRQEIVINQHSYILPQALKKWTCTNVAITPETLTVGTMVIERKLGSEDATTSSTASTLTIGPLYGELFDARIYEGSMTFEQVQEVGGRCAGPNDIGALQKRSAIGTHYDWRGCEIDAAEHYGNEPIGGRQTYGSGAFATLWLRPTKNPLNPAEWLDTPEGDFDEEWYFQQAKLQNYQWERNYFETDMIAFNQKPYRYYQDDQVRDYSLLSYNNPCRYMHQSMNNWDYHIYECCHLRKWTPRGRDGQTFDLRNIYENQGDYGYRFILHELFHFHHHYLETTYTNTANGWVFESGASFAPQQLFGGVHDTLASVSIASAWPLGYDQDDLFDEHFFSEQLSISGRIRGGHFYGSWILWWFLAEHETRPVFPNVFASDRLLGAWMLVIFVALL